MKTLDILGGKQYNINRKGDNITSIEEYTVTVSDDLTVSNMELVGTMQYSFDTDGKQFRKKYVDASGTEQKYVFEYRDEQNVAVQLPTGAVSHAKTDHLGRKVFDEIQLGKGFLNRRFTYYDGVVTDTHIDNNKRVSNPETTLVKTIDFADGRQIAYEYDREERITKVTDTVNGNATVTEYTYDEMGQLLTETVNGNLVNSMTYDQYGNILTKNGVQYGYANNNGGCCGWKDRLTSYGSDLITYDANGNPLTYKGNALTWEKGRQLKQYGNCSYTYNKDGIRISKTVNGVEHVYTLDGTNIVKETWNDNTLIPLYDLDGTVCGIKYNNIIYYFYKNLQGDVIAITDTSGNVVAQYSYDAWGVPTITQNFTCENIAAINPFRYRSYYYDTEIGLYYLQSRYYDPEFGRFIKRDNIKYISNFNLFSNLYAYCVNSPVNNIDTNGRIPGFIVGIIGVVSLVVAVVAAAFLTQDFNKVETPKATDSAEFELYLKVHFVAFGMYHSCLVVMANIANTQCISVNDNNFRWIPHPSQADFRYFTLGAGGSSRTMLSGKLVSAYNRGKDQELERAVEMQNLGNRTSNDIQKMVNYQDYYMTHDQPPYTPVPGRRSQKYNCNSFAHGLLNVMGISCSKPSHFVPGWDKPLPSKYFGV